MLLHTPASAADPARPIAAGDLVVVYEGFDSMKAVRVEEKGAYNNKYGAFMHKDWIGRPFGCKARSRRGEGWILLLAPTPELWTTVLRHRTQILYAADIAMVCALLELRPGSVVLESGTGSGSLTTSLVRAVAGVPAGHVWTFEFHEERAQIAAKEFEANGLAPYVTVTHRDIEAGGFPEALHGRADALFLDLPKPYEVVASAARCVRPDGMFCSFSPCIEQVQRTCEALNAHGFRDIRTMEVLLRQWEVQRQPLLADCEAPPPPKPQKGQQQQRGHKGQQQQGKRGGGQGGEDQGAKRQKTEGGAAAAAAPAEAAAGSPAEVATAAAGSEAAAPPQQQVQQQQVQQQPVQLPRQVVAKPVPFGRGHTGYLTFARRVVAA